MTSIEPRVVDASELGGLTLERDGVVFLSRALDPARVGELKAASDFAYALVERAMAPEPESGHAVMSGPSDGAEGAGTMDLAAEVARSSGAWGGIPIDHYIAIAKSGPDVSATFARVAEQARVAVRGATAADRATLRPDISYVRCHRASGTYAPWHFDCFAAGTSHYDPCYNCWVPFVAVGTCCPGLEFMLGTHETMRSGEFDSKHPGYPADAWMDANLNRDNHIAVRMQPGDVAVFDHYTLHRTQHGGNAGQVRTSCEMRFTLQPPA